MHILHIRQIICLKELKITTNTFDNKTVVSFRFRKPLNNLINIYNYNISVNICMLKMIRP